MVQVPRSAVTFFSKTFVLTIIKVHGASRHGGIFILKFSPRGVKSLPLESGQNHDAVWTCGGVLDSGDLHFSVQKMFKQA